MLPITSTSVKPHHLYLRPAANGSSSGGGDSSSSGSSSGEDSSSSSSEDEDGADAENTEGTEGEPEPGQSERSRRPSEDDLPRLSPELAELVTAIKDAAVRAGKTGESKQKFFSPEVNKMLLK